MSKLNRTEALTQLNTLLAKPGGKQALRFAINSIGGAVPFAGGAISAGVSIWAEREQGQANDQFVTWAQLADAEIDCLSKAVSRLVVEPSHTSMALLLGEVLGDCVASQLLSEDIYVEVVLNPSTTADLEPYLAKNWLALKSTGAVCSMGANNRVGNHIEELKRPYGLGNGFLLAVTPRGRSTVQ